jgi:hypothetical protein
VEDRQGPVKWQELSKEQQCVLFSAAEKSMLLGVLAEWEPDLDWLGRSLHVPRLAAAAESLVRAGLIDVYEDHVGTGEPALLFMQEALDAVENRNNWWREELSGDCVEGDGQDNDGTFYNLVTTDKGRDVLRSRGTDNLFAYRVR